MPLGHAPGPPGGGNPSNNLGRSGPPPGYVPGLGRGAAGFVTRSDVGPAAAAAAAGTGSRAAQLKQQQNKSNDDDNQDEHMYDAEDAAADEVWAAIDARMEEKKNRKKRRLVGPVAADSSSQQRARTQINRDFSQLKQGLANVTADEWASIPDVGDYSLKHKQKRREGYDLATPLQDSLLEQQSLRNRDATASHGSVAATTGAVDTVEADDSVTTGLSVARGTVLGLSLDRAASGTATAAVDASGYLTSLTEHNNNILTNAHNVADLAKARLLLQSVRDTNPSHGPGWIAAARVEEAAGKIWQARKLMQQACVEAAGSVDVWLEATRLHQENGRAILATAVQKLPNAVPLYLKAAELENDETRKKGVLRKGLESNPLSVTLWKAAIELESDANDARILLGLATEQVPLAAELWLALARLETYANAQRVLNRARQALPTDRSIWIAAAQLEEGQNKDPSVVINRAVSSLKKHEANISRSQWLEEAVTVCEAGSPRTSAAIVRATIAQGVEEQDRLRTWAADARNTPLPTARAILEHALSVFPSKRSLWMQFVELERKHGNAETLDDVLARACERLPKVEVFWLLRAKEQWIAGSVDKAREILSQAFATNPQSEAVWLAAAKLERENGEVERARFFLQRAREQAPTDRVFMKSALLEREEGKFEDAVTLVEEGIQKYPKFAKLYMMGGQICAESLPKEKKSLSRARKFYELGLKRCPKNATICILASRLEEGSSSFGESSGAGATKARSLLELSRLNIPKNAALWLEAVRLEGRAGNATMAETLLATALQECPTSGILLAEQIRTVPRVEKKSKATGAIKRCPDDAVVIAAVASFFASERKNDKARKWFDRATVLDPDFGDAWARFYAFELRVGTTEQQEKVKEHCVKAEPKHGEIWTCVSKNMDNRDKSVAEHLVLAAKSVLEDENR